MSGAELVREDSLTTSASEDLGTEYAAPLSEPSSASSQETGAQLYCLAVVDAETGLPRRAATADEARSVARIMARCRPPPPELQEASDADSEPAAEDYAYVTSTPLVRQGGPCRHCGARDSPQWRRGPTSKPILCNACGTRFRRTHQLMHLYGPSGIRKASGSPSTPRKRSGEPRIASKRVPALLRRASSCSTNSAVNIEAASPQSADTVVVS